MHTDAEDKFGFEIRQFNFLRSLCIEFPFHSISLSTFQTAHSAMLKKQLENLLTHLPQQSSYLYFASSCSPKPRPPHPPLASTTWPFVQACVTELSVPRKPCPPSSMPPPSQCPQAKSGTQLLGVPSRAQSAFGPDLGSFQALALLD